jgi:hypothetical protein
VERSDLGQVFFGFTDGQNKSVLIRHGLTKARQVAALQEAVPGHSAEVARPHADAKKKGALNQAPSTKFAFFPSVLASASGASLSLVGPAGR